jgi:hypothetical protein
MPNPRNAWEKTCRQMYRSIRRMIQARHSNMPEMLRIILRAPELILEHFVVILPTRMATR